MAKNLLVINVDIRETRVALIENGIIAELHIERESSKGTLGNIYLGKVSRVLPGMQAAFIDVGLERAAFLHVEDLIRPDDFEAYLAGHRHGSGATDEDRANGPPPEESAEAIAAGPGIELPTALDVAESGAAETLATAMLPVDAPAAEALAARLAPEDDDDELLTSGEASAEEADDGDDREAEATEPEPEPEDDAALEGAAPEPEIASRAHPEDVALPTFEVTAAAGPSLVPGSAPAGAPGEAPVDDATAPHSRSRRGGRAGRVRRSGRTTDRRPGATPEGEAPAPAEAAREAAPREPLGRAGARPPAAGGGGGGAGGGGVREGRQGGRDGGRQGQGGGRPGGGRGEARSDAGARAPREGRDGRGPKETASREPKRLDGGQRSSRGREGPGARRGHEPPRVSKATPIREVVREGQEVIVQISKEPIGTKGARVTSHVSLPGRYVVYLPTVDHVGISKRIGSERERGRLREAIDAMKPPTGGLIVRTLAEGLTKKQLKADVGYLVRLWGEVAKKREIHERAPTCLYTELDLVLKTARDLFTDDIEKIVIDSRTEHERLKRFVEMFLPERADCIELYEGEEPIFDAYGIEDEIARAQSRKVPLSSGGHLILDQAEALTAIDVNTGRFVGKGSKDLEETILRTNLEAVEEIAYQLRFRNIGGLIILDLIDMERANNREKVRRRLEELLARDKAKTTLNRISDLGLIEMTRKRTRESLGRIVLEPCFYCDGTGQLQSKQTIAYEILRQIRRERMNLPGYAVVVSAHPAVIDLLKSDERIAVLEAERLFERRIELVARKEYHLEQFDLQGK